MKTMCVKNYSSMKASMDCFLPKRRKKSFLCALLEAPNTLVVEGRPNFDGRLRESGNFSIAGGLLGIMDIRYADDAPRHLAMPKGPTLIKVQVSHAAWEDGICSKCLGDLMTLPYLNHFMHPFSHAKLPEFRIWANTWCSYAKAHGLVML
ncbi:hypothetical protein VNO77_38968 [Canavalia gladiata]|uniref:Uncharacterized protein n=1 Tax=Canavalia gladiata TaxID=3824 RepID=A0AAN9KA72_CANGL